MLGQDAVGAGVASDIHAFTVAPLRYVVEEGFSIMGNRVDESHPGNPIRMPSFDIDAFEVTNQQYADFLTLSLNRPGGLVLVGDEVRVPDTNLRVITLEPWRGTTHLCLGPGRESVVVDAGWENHPITGVTWFGAEAYARFVGRALPSEAEWEKTARGTTPVVKDSTFVVLVDGTSTEITVGFGMPFPWGAKLTNQHANFLDSGDPYEHSGTIRTTPVGFYDGTTHDGFSTADNAGPYGASDLLGNVAEWTADWFGPYRAPHEPPNTGTRKAVRGGAWNQAVEECSSTRRSALLPETEDGGVGFRTVGRAALSIARSQ
ncbi:MAG: SUMF1/EgtB/PvdO family nonheme iron enzyme [Candidatus Eisenbacteria bacterium]|nr:SUMF1/EgtB/PvdO family nonheme iron enzyme [Candidatus Eisenbacteria bacterium]MCC7144303.1 SUMF1/EgtB/PvdO family nonheme iron enzyme [Candidatus Eisenbacteria bacterium]